MSTDPGGEQEWIPSDPLDRTLGLLAWIQLRRYAAVLPVGFEPEGPGESVLASVAGYTVVSLIGLRSQLESLLADSAGAPSVAADLVGELVRRCAEFSDRWQEPPDNAAGFAHEVRELHRRLDGAAALLDRGLRHRVAERPET